MLILISAKSYSQTLTNEQTLKAKIAKHETRIGISDGYLKDAHIKSWYKESKTNIEHIYIQQVYKGVEVYNQLISIAFKNDNLLYSSGKFIPGIEGKAGTSTPSLSAQDAVLKAAAHLNLEGFIKNLEPISNSLSTNNTIAFSPAGISKRDIETTLYYTADSLGKLHLTWNVNIDVINKPDWWNVRVDALSGSIVEKDNWTVYEHDGKEKGTLANTNNKTGAASAFNQAEDKFLAPPSSVSSTTYYVIPFPADNRNVTPFTLVKNPWESAGINNNAATYGWQYDGAADYIITRGNNVYAYDDSAHQNKPGRPAKSITPLPDLQFIAASDFTKQPTDSINRTAAVINLFYWNNLMHDVMYQYGFDEVSGNFQASNLSRGGSGNDYVLAEAQDGSGTNNANFSTPPDGASSRMQMYLWSAAPTLTISAPSDIAGQYTNIESDFSPNNKLVKVGPVTGQVIYYNTTDTTACDSLPPGNTTLKGKIALIYRGGCNFTIKVKNAQNAGAIAAIVVNNAGSPISMGGSDSSITIPAVMISTDDGSIITGAIRAGQTVTATLANAGIALDGDLDNGIMCHEYGHGVSTRLTGGPANSSCLYNAEEAGEGWSDYQGLMMTTNWSTETLTDGGKPAV